ncbi:MAG: hypothetical protein LBU37_12585 [Tannerellaceae bacterium]|jgi:hypothetical protein|nr:hypothetical protein [Tannerellaceae bacterium]
MEFKEFKKEILKRAKESNAHTTEYQRACLSDDWPELMQVIKDIFCFSVHSKVIDQSLIEICKDQFNKYEIYCNENVVDGFLLASGNVTVIAIENITVRAIENATVIASDDATVIASDNVTVRAIENATVRASGNVTVEASDNATVEAWVNAYIASRRTIECKLRDNAIYRIRESNTVRYASDDMKFEKI